MATPRMTREMMQEAIDLVAEHGTIVAAAAAVGVAVGAMQKRVKNAIAAGIPDPRAAKRLWRAAATGELGGPPIPAIAKPPPGFAITKNSGVYDKDGNLLRQAVQSKRDSGDEYAVPAGHVVKGESALLDQEGRVLAKWVKTRTGAGEGLVDALRATFDAYTGAAPAIKAPAADEAGLLTVYPVPDLHLGMYSWGAETGSDYDVDVAVAIARRAVAQLVEQSRPSRRAVLLGLGDYFHANDAKAVTPGSGHQLDVDGRWPKVFALGARLATELVDALARKHQDVEVVFLPGNHDPDAAVSITVALALFYSRTPRIQVFQKPGPVWYRRFGRCLLGATHGHTMKPAGMAMALAQDCAEEWGVTTHRHVFFGHIHHERAIEQGGVRCEAFNSPAAADAWNNSRGYRSARAMSAITFHQDRGEIGRHRVHIDRGAAS